jgi:hypothetical protein
MSGGWRDPTGKRGRRLGAGSLAACACIGLGLLAAWLLLADAAPRASTGAEGSAGTPRIEHLFVIVMENENAAETFGEDPPAPYLGTTLRQKGAFIPNYFGVGHLSLDNYIAMVSGQPPNLQTQADCQVFTEMLPGTVQRDGVALGQGCVYPRSVRTIANQLESSGRTWRGYMQDMASSTAAGEAASCRHPAIGSSDPTQQARAGDQYAARHNPFVYFHSIIDYPSCGQNDVDLSRLPSDLASEATTPAYSFITPDLCYDGHDATCADGVSPGGFAGIEAFLREWVPQIKASPAYQDHGAILITFDESESGAESCCGERTSPNTSNYGGATPGKGGGRIGAVLLSPCVEPGTVTAASYNHYSFLRWSEDNFGLPHLAEAGVEGLQPFDSDVFTRPGCAAGKGGGSSGEGGAGAVLRLMVKPRRVRAGTRHVFRFRLLGDPTCARGGRIRFAGHVTRTNARGRGRLKLRIQRLGKHVARVLPKSACPKPRAVVRVFEPYDTL